MIYFLFAVIHLINTSFIKVSPNKRIIGKLVEKVEAKFDCGVLKVGVVNKFVIVEHKIETRDTVKVVCICLENYGKDFLTAGNLYSLTIDKNLDSLKDCYILDKYPSQKLDVWVLQAIAKYKSP